MSTNPITAAKNAQGYVSATQRKRCGSCQHLNEAYGSTLQCRTGGYLVSLYAVCDRWAIKQPPGFKQPTG
jgi:hypothetical protein